MYEIANEVEIDGTVEQVRQVLSGFDNFDAWNPVIRNVAGTLTVGQNVVISVAAPTGLRDWNVAVVRVDPGREFAWTFFERHPWLYRGEHTFRVEPIDSHRTRYLDRETFHGLLVPSRRRQLGTKTKAGMVAMGEALKHRVETNQRWT